MRPQSSDPNMRRYDRQDEMKACPECRAWMLPLREYEISKDSEAPALEADAEDYILFGWWAYVGNYINDLFTLESRKKKLAQQKQTLLPQFPNTLVCTRCLHIIKRP